MQQNIMRPRTVVVFVLVGVASGLLFLGVANQALGTLESVQTANRVETTSAVTVHLYMKIQGESQGLIEGDVTTAGHEGEILVLSYSAGIWMPTDPLSGSATGVRRHQSIVITKELDKASPKLYQALFTGERLSMVEMKFFRPSLSSGQQEHYFTIKLQNAIIVSIKSYVPMTGAGDALPIEEVSFNYQKITLTDEINGVEATVNWGTPAT